MKTTVEIPDPLFRRAKAEAALRGESLRSLIEAALREHLRSTALATEAPGWTKAFGRASADEVREVDAVVERDLQTVEFEDWR